MLSWEVVSFLLSSVKCQSICFPTSSSIYYTFSSLPIRVAKGISIWFLSFIIRKVEHLFICLKAICVCVLIFFLGCWPFKINFVGTFYIIRKLTLWIWAAKLYPYPCCPVSCLLTCFYVYFSKLEFFLYVCGQIYLLL